MSVNEKMTAIADSIRSCTGETELLGLEEMVGRIRDVYLSGAYDAGYGNGEKDGSDTGKQAALETVWNGIQTNGTRTNYNAAFMLCGDLDKWFFPRHDFNMESTTQMFRGAKTNGLELAQRLRDCDVTMDFSQCTDFIMQFAYADFATLPRIDMSRLNAARADMAFSGCEVLHTIEALVPPATEMSSNAFHNCKQLQNITIDGTIAVNGFHFQWSTKLSKASIESVIGALSTETSGLAITLSKEAVDAAFYDHEADYEGSDSDEWETLIAARPNWTINLV